MVDLVVREVLVLATAERSLSVIETGRGFVVDHPVVLWAVHYLGSSESAW